MKKAVFLFLFIVALAAGVSAQVPVEMVGKTFLYYLIEEIDTNTGERNGTDGTSRVYYTFTSKDCSEKRTNIRGANTYQFLKEENDMYVFSRSIRHFAYYLYFSKDFKRVNTRTFYLYENRWENLVGVWDQSKPKPIIPPVIMY